MRWDPARPVPVRRLLREWAIVAPIMVLLLWWLGRDGGGFAGALVGVAASLPLYLAFGYVLAKLGYQRRTLADLRTPRATPAASPDAAPARPRPAPTRRTSSGPNRRATKRR